MNLPLKILLVERRQPDGCLRRALQGEFALEFEWRRVSSENELRIVAREYDPTVVLCADDMQGRSHQAIAQMLCMLSPQRPKVLICELGDGSAWLCAGGADLTAAPAQLPAVERAVPGAGAAVVPAPAVRLDAPDILRSSLDAVVMLDAEGWIDDLNEHAQRLLGARECSKSKLHVGDLIRGLQGAGEGGCTSLPLVAVNLDGLLSLNAVHGMHYGNAVIDLIASVVQPQYARCGLLVRLGVNQYLAVLPHLSAPADAAASVSGGRQLGMDADLTAVFGEVTANDADINDTSSWKQLPATPSIDALLAADESTLKPTATQMCGRAAARPGVALTSAAADLGDAVQRHALSVYFQPQYELLSGRGSGVEALARWTLTNGRILSPGLFIPVAERTGAIGALDAWVLERACALGAAWRGRDTEQLTLSVNVSNRQIGVAHARMLESILENSGFPAQRLELEIEEGPILAGDPSIDACLRQWKQLGVRIAVNHRSANYSSLAYLSRFAVDRLKLDKSLIHRMPHHRGTAAMVQAVIALGTELDVNVIAEGVETHVQLEMLKSLGCRHAQGYLLARPMPAIQAQIALRKTWGNLDAHPEQRSAAKPTPQSVAV